MRVHDKFVALQSVPYFIYLFTFSAAFDIRCGEANIKEITVTNSVRFVKLCPLQMDIGSH